MTPAEALDTPSLTPREGLGHGRRSAEIKRERDVEKGYLGDDDPMLEDSNDFLKVLREIQMLETQSIVSSDVETPAVSDAETSSSLLLGSESETESEKVSTSLGEADNEKPHVPAPLRLGVFPEDLVKGIPDQDLVSPQTPEPQQEESQGLETVVNDDPVVRVEDHKDEDVGGQPAQQQQPNSIPGSDSIQDPVNPVPPSPPSTFQLVLAFFLPLLVCLPSFLLSLWVSSTDQMKTRKGNHRKALQEDVCQCL